jgi:hypothetical protein
VAMNRAHCRTPHIRPGVSLPYTCTAGTSVKRDSVMPTAKGIPLTTRKSRCRRCAVSRSLFRWCDGPSWCDGSGADGRPGGSGRKASARNLRALRVGDGAARSVRCRQAGPAGHGMAMVGKGQRVWRPGEHGTQHMGLFASAATRCTGCCVGGLADQRGRRAGHGP